MRPIFSTGASPGSHVRQRTDKITGEDVFLSVFSAYVYMYAILESASPSETLSDAI
jgi:hypothetical protein